MSDFLVFVIGMGLIAIIVYVAYIIFKIEEDDFG